MKIPKAIKVFYMGNQLRDIYPHCTRWQYIWYKITRFVRAVVLTILLIATAIGLVYTGAKFYPTTVYQDKPVIVQVVAPSPVLDRIAKCESGNTQWDKNGQVLLNYNASNSSFDIGVMQINIKAFGAQATALGYNLSVEKDNRAMGLWIYQHRGTEDWYSSKSCWNK